MNKFFMSSVFVAVVCASFFVEVGCSSTGDVAAPSAGDAVVPTPAPSDGVVVNPGETTTPPSDGSVGPTPPVAASPPTDQASCVAACETAHPTAQAKNKNLDATCFLGGACEPVCNDLKYTGKNFTPTDVDGGVVCDTAKAGAFPIATPSQACSDCLANNASCCSQWNALFGSADGQALNACSTDCFVKFTK